MGGRGGKKQMLSFSLGFPRNRTRKTMLLSNQDYGPLSCISCQQRMQARTLRVLSGDSMGHARPSCHLLGATSRAFKASST